MDRSAVCDAVYLGLKVWVGGGWEGRLNYGSAVKFDEVFELAFCVFVRCERVCQDVEC